MGPAPARACWPTATLRAVARHATPPSVLLTGAARVHSPAPYDWLAAVLSAHEPPQTAVPADALAWLAQDPDAPRERYTPDALLRMAVRTVRALIGAGPAILVVEDLHDLDPASLNLVGELATGPRLPALLLVTARQPADEVAARALTRLCGAPGAVRLHLGPLTHAEVSALVRRTWPAATSDVVDAVMARTCGNPHLVKELVATTPDDQSVTDAAMTTSRALRSPAGVGNLTAREVEVLGCLADGMSNKQVARSLGILVEGPQAQREPDREDAGEQRERP